MKKNNVTAEKTAAAEKYTVANSLTSYYLAMMFGFFPLFLTEQYAHARTDKFWLFMVMSAALVISVTACRLMYKNEAKRLNTTCRLFAPLSSADILMLCFLGFAAISTVLSPYFGDALTGFAGRDNGLLLLAMYTLVYFTVSRNYVYKDYVIAVYLIISGFVALLTVLNFYYIDPLHMLEGYDADTIADFGSTIGNKNMIAAFMCLYLPVAVMVFSVTKKRNLRILSGVSLVLSYTGLICADSTSDILGLMVAVPVMAILCARNAEYLRRYFLALAIMLLSAKLLLLFGEHNKGFEFIQEAMINSPAVYILAAISLVIYAILLVINKNEGITYPAKGVQIGFTVLFVIGIISAVTAFCCYSFIDTKTELGSFEKLLRFSDSWGTHRGFMWRVSFEEYSKFDLVHLLFGMGPDTAYHVLEPHFAELLERFGDGSTDSAHNEYINYLLTQGALGLLSYLSFVTAVIVRGIKNAKNSTLTLVIIPALLCYLAQASVNLYTPIVTPLLFIFIAMCEAVNRNTDSRIDV